VELNAEQSSLLPLGVALAIGLIVGFERGWRQEEAREHRAEGTDDVLRVAGIRTFALVGLLGGVLATVAQAQESGLLLVAGVFALGALLVAGYLRAARTAEDVGATTEIALLLTYGLGALPAFGLAGEAIAAAVVTAMLLGFKRRIHGTLGRLELKEVQASLQLLLIALVVLPLLPDRAMGPWEALNPRMIGLLVLLIAGIGFLGYVAERLAGQRTGLLVTAVLGGIASSTAVTVAFSRLARRGAAPAAVLGAGIGLACATMGPRMLVEVFVVNAALAPRVLPGALALAVVPLLAAPWVARRHGDVGESGLVGLDNPLELRQAVLVAALLTGIFLLAHGAEATFGDRGVYVLAVLSGIGDVDAITLSLAQQARTSLDDTVAARAIVLAALTNTAVKASLAGLLGGVALARWASVILVAALAAGAATLPFL
jgi:uncharacterized membrane protein (DUF4010 family)